MSTAQLATTVRYGVMIEFYERGATFAFSLAEAVDSSRSDNPYDCSINVYYPDGEHRYLDPSDLSRPTLSNEEQRARLIGIATKNLPLLPPEPSQYMNEVCKKTWELWLSDGPTTEDIANHQRLTAEWLPADEIAAYEQTHL